MPDQGTEQRKLAAIMFTDMVGYTALSQRNETLALELLEEHRHLLRGLFPRFAGQEIKTMGDGFLVEFASALEAAKCAIEIQRALAQRNLSVPSERQLQVRIGIHIGDVVHRGGDVLGDGVNIASRIEPLAEPGGICISVDVAHQIQHNLEAAVVQVGAAALKNVAVPLEVCRIVLPWEKQGPTRNAEAHIRELSAPAKSTHRLAPALLALVGLAVLGVVGWWAYPHFGKAPSPNAIPQAKTPSTTPSPADTRSVAVLPFAIMSPEREKDEYLSEGITEHLCTVLSQVRGLRVPGRTSCAVFKGKQEDIRKIGEQLNVATVLEGSVQRAGSQLRITAQLINVADGFHLWSETYDRDMTNIFTIQSDVAQQVVAALKLRLGMADTQRLQKQPTENVEAYNCYLQGRFWWNKRTLEALYKAIHQFQAAIALDPNCAVAYAGLADAYALLAYYGSVAPKECFPQAKAAATKAVALDDQLSEGHVSLALVRLMWDWDWRGAESEFGRAIELNPNNSTAHHWYSHYLRIMRRFHDGVAEVRKAQALDPLSSIIGAQLGETLVLAGQYDLAITEYQKNLERDPNFHVTYYLLSRAYSLRGNYPEAIAAARKSCELAPDALFNPVALAVVYAEAGQQAEAKKILDKLIAQSRQAYFPAFQIALLCAASGDNEQALRWLEKAYDERAYRLGYVNAEPLFDRLRTEPRFIAFLRKMGLQP